MSQNNKPRKIIIIEDEKTLAGLYADKLVEAGFEVKVFTDASEILKGCEFYKPEIAFVDHTLGSEKISGTDAIPILRKCNPHMKIVMLTNYSEFQVKDNAKQAGADDYLLKINTPPDALVSYVQQH